MTTAKKQKKGIYIYFLPNLFTTVNLAMGFFSIILSTSGRLEYAVYAIGVAAVFDALDGRMARLVKAESSFGEQYDSLSDLISFGMAPAIFVYQWSLADYGRVGLVAALLFVVCGALRLARFNVMVNVVSSKYFQGLPIPMSAATLVSFWMFAGEIGFDPTVDNHATAPMPVLFMTIFLGILMISTIRFPSFKELNLESRQVMKVFIITIGVLLLVAMRHETMIFITLSSYILWSIFMNIRVYLNRRRNKSFSSVFYDEPSLISETDDFEASEAEKTEAKNSTKDKVNESTDQKVH
jgi:CDP-diacylglycerol--serine O-phosphatidyltransferase